MKAEHVNPFIQSTLDVFKTMIGVTPTKGDVYLKHDDSSTHEISGVIGIAGAATGYVVISMPETLALDVVSGFIGEKKSSIDEDVIDAIGEITNMVAGSTKQVFSEKGIRFKISIPNVVVGHNHRITRPKGVPCICVKFTIDNTEFVIEIGLVEDS